MPSRGSDTADEKTTSENFKNNFQIDLNVRSRLAVKLTRLIFKRIFQILPTVTENF